jgi:cytochrome P450
VSAPSATEAGDWTVPEHVPAELVRPLDFWNGADYLADPVGYWDGARAAHRAFWSPFFGGFWCLTRYGDIHAALQRPQDFSSRINGIPSRGMQMLPITLDPPDHTKYRRLLNEPFAPAQVEKLSGAIRGRCAELVDDLVDGPGCEFITEFAKALPTYIFCDLLGLPKAEVKTFLDWNHTILHVHGTAEGRERQRVANEELGVYLRQLVAQRHAHREVDLVSRLLDCEVDGERLTQEEAYNFTYLLFMAGLDTVTNSLGFTWMYLAQHPGHRRQIVDDPRVVPAAVEELLRYYSFVEITNRTVSRDLEFAGVAMKGGDRIMLPTSAAGRDDEQFPDAHVVDFGREPNRHLAFAAGPHRCLGSHLARSELRIALEEWHARIPEYRIAAGTGVTYHGGALGGPAALSLEWP